MSKVKKRKILKRLTRLERAVRMYEKRDRRSKGRSEPDEPRGGFDEKRVIDTVVRLVVERVARVIQRENEIQARHLREDRHREGGRGDGRGDRGHDRGRDDRRDDRSRDEGGRDRHRGESGEKRLVDLVVRLVAEHVQEIVVTELDRHLGPAVDLDLFDDDDDDDDLDSGRSGSEGKRLSPPREGADSSKED